MEPHGGGTAWWSDCSITLRSLGFLPPMCATTKKKHKKQRTYTTTKKLTKISIVIIYWLHFQWINRARLITLKWPFCFHSLSISHSQSPSVSQNSSTNQVTCKSEPPWIGSFWERIPDTKFFKNFTQLDFGTKKWEFSHVFSNCLFEQMQSHNSCRCAKFLH